MADSRFVYVTFIRTTPEKLWQALLEPEFTRQFWYGTSQDWRVELGASWRLMTPDGRVANSGEVLEIDPQRRLVLSWRKEFEPTLNAEGYSRMHLRARTAGRHGQADRDPRDRQTEIEIDRSGRQGWPMILSSLKSSARDGRTARGNSPLAQRI